MMINGTQSGSGRMEMSVLEKQRAVWKWHQDHLQFPQQQQQTYFSDFQGGLLNELLAARPIKPDPGLDGISRIPSCPPAAATKESFGKRKADHNTLLPPTQAEDESRAKKTKGSCEEEESVPSNNNYNNSSKNSHSSSSCNKNTKNGNKENKIKEASAGQKQDYIHVRARRGQATDSHSLAERVRREKISKRMKYLQDLVPGCNKITGKAGMLDEIINYVQSLQRQVEFLSMKLATVNPTLDFNIEDLFAKEVFQACSSNYPASGITSDTANLAYLQYNQGQQMGPISASDLGMSEVETFLDSSCLTQQIQTYIPWDQSDVQSIYNMDFQQARHESFPSQTYTGAN